MPKKKIIIPSFDKNQRRLIWTMLSLIVIAAVFLFFFSWRLSRLDTLPSLSKIQALPSLFQGEVLTEKKVAVVPINHGFEELSLLSSPDGRSYAYIWKKEKAQAAVLNESAGPDFDSITAMAFSPDSQSFAYTAKRGNKEVAVINGRESREYDWIFTPRLFTPDSRFFIYKGRRDGKDFLVINTKESRAYDRIYDLMLSPDKSAMIFFARDGDNLWRGEIPLDSEK